VRRELSERGATPKERDLPAGWGGSDSTGSTAGCSNSRSRRSRQEANEGGEGGEEGRDDKSLMDDGRTMSSIHLRRLL